MCCVHACVHLCVCVHARICVHVRILVYNYSQTDSYLMHITHDQAEAHVVDEIIIIYDEM